MYAVDQQGDRSKTEYRQDYPEDELLQKKILEIQGAAEALIPMHAPTVPIIRPTGDFGSGNCLVLWIPTTQPYRRFLKPPSGPTSQTIHTSLAFAEKYQEFPESQIDSPECVAYRMKRPQ